MNRKEHLLTILSEECSEIIKDVSKSLRFGLDDCKPGTNVSNSENLTNEIADFLGVIEMLYEENIIEKHSLEKILLKKQKIEKYMEYSKSKGSLKDIDDKLPERCPCCFKEADYTDIIKKSENDLHEAFEYETDAWFCNYCGGLVCWKK